MLIIRGKLSADCLRAVCILQEHEHKKKKK